MATRLITDLGESDRTRWEVMEQAALDSLQARLDLWNAISETLSGR